MIIRLIDRWSVEETPSPIDPWNYKGKPPAFRYAQRVFIATPAGVRRGQIAGFDGDLVIVRVDLTRKVGDRLVPAGTERNAFNPVFLKAV